jgi:hypothetical protein
MRRVPLIAICAVVAGAGCGGSGDGGSDSPTTSAGGAVSKQQFIAQADAACKKFDDRLKGLARAKSFDDVARTYRESAREARAFYEDFRAIPRPRGDERILSRYQEVLNDSISVTEQGAAAIEGSDDKRLRGLTREASRLRRENTRISRRYGFKVCGATVSK